LTFSFVTQSADAGFESYINSFDMKFVPIESGTFLMGSLEDKSERWVDETQHEVVP